ncbi:MAG: hypothetical protein QOG77_2766, partial [Solirubrobacteraceae bacterium]|nr:hypothetical protein [Solirubrobacteraceae bacterium]
MKNTAGAGSNAVSHELEDGTTLVWSL